MIDALLEVHNVNWELDSNSSSSALNGLHRSEALSQLAPGEERYDWQSEGFEAWLSIAKDYQPLTAWKIIIYEPSCNTLLRLVLSESMFFMF